MLVGLVLLVLYAVFIYVNNDLREFKFSMLKRARNAVIKSNQNQANPQAQPQSEKPLPNTQPNSQEEQEKSVDDTFNSLEQEDNFDDILE